MSVRWFKKSKPSWNKEKNAVYKISGVTRPVFDMLVAALNWCKPKTDDDFYHSAEARKVFKALLKDTEDINPQNNKVAIEEGESVDLLFENGPFRFLERAFKSARESGEVYLAAGAEHVVCAMEVMKASVKLPKDDAKSKKNGSENRVENVLAMARKSKADDTADDACDDDDKTDKD